MAHFASSTGTGATTIGTRTLGHRTGKRLPRASFEQCYTDEGTCRRARPRSRIRLSPLPRSILGSVCGGVFAISLAFSSIIALQPSSCQGALVLERSTARTARILDLLDRSRRSTARPNSTARTARPTRQGLDSQENFFFSREDRRSDCFGVPAPIARSEDPAPDKLAFDAAVCITRARSGASPWSSIATSRARHWDAPKKTAKTRMTPAQSRPWNTPSAARPRAPTSAPAPAPPPASGSSAERKPRRAIRIQDVRPGNPRGHADRQSQQRLAPSWRTSPAKSRRAPPKHQCVLPGEPSLPRAAPSMPTRPPAIPTGPRNRSENQAAMSPQQSPPGSPASR